MKPTKVLTAFTLLLAFAFQVSAQSNSYPNELKGYEFYDEGKLKKLKPGVSTKQDVVEIFGESCEIRCDYNKNWLIQFTYFDDIRKGGWRKEKTYIPVSRYLGKLYSISLRPNLKISFKEADFPSHFKFSAKGSKGVYGDDEATIYYFSYDDRYGLECCLFDKRNSTRYKNSSRWKKGDLLSIEYNIRDELEKRMFVEKK